MSERAKDILYRLGKGARLKSSVRSKSPTCLPSTSSLSPSCSKPLQMAAEVHVSASPSPSVSDTVMMTAIQQTSSLQTAKSVCSGMSSVTPIHRTSGLENVMSVCSGSSPVGIAHSPSDPNTVTAICGDTHRPPGITTFAQATPDPLTVMSTAGGISGGVADFHATSPPSSDQNLVTAGRGVHFGQNVRAPHPSSVQFMDMAGRGSRQFLPASHSTPGHLSGVPQGYYSSPYPYGGFGVGPYHAAPPPPGQFMDTAGRGGLFGQSMNTHLPPSVHFMDMAGRASQQYMPVSHPPMGHFSGGPQFFSPPYYQAPQTALPTSSRVSNHTPVSASSTVTASTSSLASHEVEAEPVTPTPSHPSLEVEAESASDSDTTSVGHGEAEVDEHEETANTFSLTEAIRRLAVVAPAMVGDAPGLSSKLPGRRLGRLSGNPRGALALKESTSVKDGVLAALKKVRGEETPPAAGTAPSLPAALGCGVFLKADKVKGKLFIPDSIPAERLQCSREDLLLLPEAERSKPRSLEIKDKNLVEFEDHTRLALQSLSAMDSFLEGIILSLSDSADDFKLKSDISSEDLTAFIEALDDRLKATTSLVSSLHINVILCRRDAILRKSKVVTDPNCRASLRAVPLHASTLFGNGHVVPTIHGIAESKRDLVMAGPRTASRSRSPGRKSNGFASKQGQRSRSSPAASGRGGKSRGGGAFKKPYDRKQAPKASSKPHPQ